MKYITVFNIVAKSLSFLPFFIFIRKPENYIYVPICYSFGFILAGIVSIFIVYFRMGMRWYFTSIEEISNSLKDSSTYFLSRASTSLFTTSNSFLLGLICGNTAVGYYSAAEKLYQAYNQLLTPFTGVLFPHIAKSRDVLFFKKVFYKITFANFFCVTTVLLFSSYVLRFVYGTADPDILEVFRLFRNHPLYVTRISISGGHGAPSIYELYSYDHLHGTHHRISDPICLRNDRPYHGSYDGSRV